MDILNAQQAKGLAIQHFNIDKINQMIVQAATQGFSGISVPLLSPDMIEILKNKGFWILRVMRRENDNVSHQIYW